jgi:predicted ribosome quality control (RQC) complex YloA/Tae2 family protein
MILAKHKANIGEYEDAIRYLETAKKSTNSQELQKSIEEQMKTLVDKLASDYKVLP